MIYSIMFFFIAASSISGFFIVQFGKNYVSNQTMFMISGAFTAMNMVMLYFFDDSEMISKATLER